MLTQKLKAGINKDLGSLNRWRTKLDGGYYVTWNEVQTREFRMRIFSVLFFHDSRTFPFKT